MDDAADVRPATTSRARSHLSIGEVLALLLEEFPDITISKIRFLESQGLIDPERTPSGYRKFYDDDVELLRCILREQRENYLPLRVIKDRLDSGQIDPTSELVRPAGIANDPDDGDADADEEADPTPPALTPNVPLSDVPVVDTSVVDPSGALRAATVPDDSRLSGAELCAVAGISDEHLASLESYGVITGDRETYGPDAVDIAKIAKRFLDVGFDARHLRGWKVAADREAGLFEQMIQPLVRQRNPQALAQAREQLAAMDGAGSLLRSALMRAALRPHFED